MKKTLGFRLLCLMLAVSLLAGCGAAKTPENTTGAATQGTAPGETTAPTEASGPAQSTQLPEQQEMPAAELEKALADIDLSVLCAAFDAALRNEKLERPEVMLQSQVICADYNGDGYRDILLGKNSHLSFSVAPERAVDYRTQAFSELAGLSPIICADKDGNIYKWDRVEEGFDIEVDGKPAVTTYLEEAYSRWQNGAWETVCAYKGENTAVYGPGADGQITGTVVSEEGSATIQGSTGTYAQLQAWLEQVGMHQVSTRPCENVENTYDAAYWNCLLEALDAYLKENYPEYRQMLMQDIDGDGDEEAVFLVPGFVETWFNSFLDKGAEYLENAQRNFRWNFPETFSPTGVLVVEAVDGKLTVSAHCALKNIDFSADMTVRRENGKLVFDGEAVHQNGSLEGMSGEQIPQALESYMQAYGYDEFFCRKVDLSDLAGQEYLCVSTKDGQWYVFIFVIIKGNPVVLYTNTVQDCAMFLTEYNGSQALLTYQQSVYEQDGENVTNYSFRVVRLGENGEEVILDSAYTSYTDSDLDATKIALFFQKPVEYLLKITVIYDLYKLTGKQWMDPTDAEYGEPPKEEATPGETPSNEAPQLGFVQIQDPSSWLHLRVGPGVEYDKVLMDPNDPDSFVRQALGSPLTVLESAQSDDPANPVWLKIRIIYGDRIIVGWSSKTYIRLINEA